MAEKKTDEENSTEKKNRVKINHLPSNDLAVGINPMLKGYSFTAEPQKHNDYVRNAEMIEDVERQVVIPDDSDVPDYIYAALEDDGYRVVLGAETGWKKWEGRPEWSDRYVDFENAEFWAQE